MQLWFLIGWMLYSFSMGVIKILSHNVQCESSLSDQKTPTSITVVLVSLTQSRKRCWIESAVTSFTTSVAVDESLFCFAQCVDRATAAG